MNLSGFIIYLHNFIPNRLSLLTIDDCLLPNAYYLMPIT